MSLTAEQILALAPDASSAKAGSGLSGPAKWHATGRNAQAVWGECQGSGKDPYRTQIDLAEPAFKCSCPSRKFPCKHGIGLYLLLASNAPLFAEAAPPQWVADWLASRQQRTEKQAEKQAEKQREKAEAPPEQAAALAAAAKKREDKRESKVAAGLAELQTWLEDLAREGLSTLRGRGPAFWEAIAARMVDAQCGTLAARLRRVSGICFQTNLPDWETRLARELAALYLLTEAARRMPALPAQLQSDVRSQIGWNTAQEDLLAQDGVQDRWLVLAQSTRDEDRVRARSTWLRGAASGRWALVLQYAAGTQGFDRVLAPGTGFDGELCFYPGAQPLRAVVKRQDGVAPLGPALPPAAGLEDILDGYASAIAAQPFLERYPVLADAVVPRMDGGARVEWPDGRSLPLHPAFRFPWQLLGMSGGHRLAIAGEWDGHTLLPLSVFSDGRLYNFESDFAA